MLKDFSGEPARHLTHAVLHYSRKSDERMALLLLYSMIMTIGQLLFKYTSLSIKAGSGPISIIYLPIALLREASFISALLLYFFATCLWIVIIRQIPLSVAYPTAVGACVLLLTCLDSVVNKVPFSSSVLLGSIVIILGVFIVTSSGNGV